MGNVTSRSRLQREKLEHFYFMHVSSLIIYPESKQKFIKFLRAGHRNDESGVLTHIKCFDLCNTFLYNPELICDSEQMYELFLACPSYEWESRLEEAIYFDKQTHIHYIRVKRVLNELKCESVHNIECHHDYKRFKMYLLRKLNIH